MGRTDPPQGTLGPPPNNTDRSLMPLVDRHRSAWDARRVPWARQYPLGEATWLGCPCRAPRQILILLVLVVSVGTAAAESLIANPTVGVQSLSQNEARLFVSMRLAQWPNGERVRVFVLPDNHPLHERVVKGILGLYPYQLRRAWDRQLFSGTGQAPVTVATESELIDRVAKTPGAIGYAESGKQNPAVRTLEVR